MSKQATVEQQAEVILNVIEKDSVMYEGDYESEAFKKYFIDHCPLLNIWKDDGLLSITTEEECKASGIKKAREVVETIKKEMNEMTDSEKQRYMQVINKRLYWFASLSYKWGGTD